MRESVGSRSGLVIPKIIIEYTNCIPAWHAGVRVGVYECNLLHRSLHIIRKSRVLYPGPGFQTNAICVFDAEKAL